MATDPICGMKVNEEEARKNNLSIKKQGKEYFFCSENCKTKFSDKENTKSPWYQSKTFSKTFPWILGIVLIVGSITSIYYGFMTQYMGIFFIIFSLAKLLDVKGFAKAFKQYDLFAKYIPFYAASYPFIEFILGILYLFNFFINIAAIITIIILGMGSIGIIKNLLSKNKVQCACLGTKLNVPLTKVTLLEDIIMVLMAIMLLI